METEINYIRANLLWFWYGGAAHLDPGYSMCLHSCIYVFATAFVLGLGYLHLVFYHLLRLISEVEWRLVKWNGTSGSVGGHLVPSHTIQLPRPPSLSFCISRIARSRFISNWNILRKL